MRTKITIAGIVLGVVLTCLTIAAALIVWLEVAGLVLVLVGAAAVLTVYRFVIRPWHSSWGATEDEVAAPMPGDDVIPEAASTTRGITIAAAPDLVWPWLVQLGYGKAGWYSYDWIDNDGKQSARELVPQFQHLAVGDTIAMLPDFGPVVREMQPPHALVVGDAESGTWCLALRQTPEGTRLVSRWRQAWKASNPLVWFWIAISDPGAFIMERKMLLGIKERVERSGSPQGDASPAFSAPGV